MCNKHNRKYYKKENDSRNVSEIDDQITGKPQRLEPKFSKTLKKVNEYFNVRTFWEVFWEPWGGWDHFGRCFTPVGG